MQKNKPYLKEMIDFLKTRKKWWLAPIIILLVLAGILVIIGNTSSVSSFVYALF